MKARYNQGFSLIQVVISIGLVSFLSVTGMRLVSNAHVGMRQVSSIADAVDLKNEIRMILGSEKHCRVSLAGNGDLFLPTTPVTFEKQDNDEVGEGLDIELFFSNQDGDARGSKRLSASDNAKNRYGKLDIKSIKLLMINGVGSNYGDSPDHTDIGEIIIRIEKKISSTQTRETEMTFPVSVRMRTNSLGVTTIISCATANPSMQEMSVLVWGGRTYGKGRREDWSSIDTFRCPAGSALAEIEANTGDYWDSAIFQCRSLSDFSITLTSARFGDQDSAEGVSAGLGSVNCSCPSGGFIKNLYSFTGSRHNNVTGECVDKNFIPIGRIALCGYGVGGGPNQASSECPDNSIAIGVQISHINDPTGPKERINFVQLLCEKKMKVPTF